MLRWIARAALAAFTMFAAAAVAQTTARVTGDLSATVPGIFTLALTFECTGAPTCTGTYRAVWQISGCSNSIVLTDKIVITGVGFTPGPLGGRVTLTELEVDGTNSAGLCTVTSTTDFDDSYTGSSDGTTGTFTVMPADFPGTTFTGHFALSRVAPPVFQMTVSGQIDAARADVAANLTFRPQDVGTTGSVYVFALAPATRVSNASSEKAAHLGWMATVAEKDTPVPCVLAQLNAAGQLKAVSASSLQAYVTGVLSGQGQAVNVLNNVPTVNIAGATFYLGYGPNSTTMINSGTNRNVVAAPGSEKCEPAPPQTGWWWNTVEGGRGYSIEVAGNHIVFASYLYDVSGRATWLLASGNTSLDGTLFTGGLENYAQGQTLAGAYRPPTGAVGGPITLAFSDTAHGTLSWPGGTIPIERFNILPNGLSLAPRAGQPQGGWWWNPAESGRGFFLEWQGGQLFMAGYMYDDAGNPIWYLSGNSTPSTNLQSYSNQWLQFGNGQTLTGTYRAPVQVNGNVAPVTITFQGAENAIMTLPGGRTTSITRFRF